jgi:hypothetical protein
MALAWKLLTLITVLMMPFAMGAAPAAAAQHHGAPMPMQHCPDQGNKHDKGVFAECTMACSAALPAAELARDQVALTSCEPVPATVQPVLLGFHPDTATPPPKKA